MSKKHLVGKIESFKYDGQEVGHDSSLYSGISNHEDIRNVVVDLNVIMAGIDQTINTSYDLIEDIDRLEQTPVFELADSNNNFKTETLPEENFEIMSDVAEEAILYVPDHIMECLPKALDNQFGGTGYYTQAEEIHDNIFEFLNFYADPLSVKERMGVDYYTTNSLKSKHGSKTEDDFIIETANELEGNTVIMTYDSDYLRTDVDAAAPKALKHVLED